jgi:uncharacterized protein (DUF2141 family)
VKRFALLLALPLLAGATSGSPRELGKAEGACRAGDNGPVFLVRAAGLKDHVGDLKLEVYPPTDPDFLQDDARLVNAGKVFRRVEVPVPPGAQPELCIRVPAAGTYTMVLLHDRDRDHRFHWTTDGIGFGSNPRLGLSQPKAAQARVTAGPGETRVTIVLNYLHGLAMRPLKE